VLDANTIQPIKIVETVLSLDLTGSKVVVGDGSDLDMLKKNILRYFLLAQNLAKNSLIG